MRRASADGARIGAPSPGAPGREPLWSSLLLGAPTIPSWPANRSTPWARTLPRGKKPPAQFPARLGCAAPFLAGAQAASAQALSGAGYRAAGGGWRGGNQACLCLCWLGTAPLPNGLEVEVTSEPGHSVQGSGAGWAQGGSRCQQPPLHPPAQQCPPGKACGTELLAQDSGARITELHLPSVCPPGLSRCSGTVRVPGRTCCHGPWFQEGEATWVPAQVSPQEAVAQHQGKCTSAWRVAPALIGCAPGQWAPVSSASFLVCFVAKV